MSTNKEIRDRFLKVADVRGINPTTVYRYRRWIRKFLRYHDGLALEQVELEEVDGFLETSLHLSPSTRNQAKNALNFLFEIVLQKNLNVSLVRPQKRNYFSSWGKWLLKGIRNTSNNYLKRP